MKIQLKSCEINCYLRSMISNRLSATLLITLLPVILFTVSLFCVAFVYKSNDGIAHPQGYEVFIMGGTAILGGGLLEWVIWLANPIAFFALYYFRQAVKLEVPHTLRLRARRRSQWMATAAMTLALSFRCWKEVLRNEAGSMGPIVSFGYGYYLWAAAMIILCFSINFYALSIRTKING